MNSHTTTRPVKAGDMAVIVRSNTNPDQVGRFVDVIELIPADAEVVTIGSTTWAIKLQGLRHWIIRYAGGEVVDGDAYGVWAERCLQPIRGSFSPAKTKTTRPLEQTV